MDRILATHTGSLIRPPELLAFLAAKERGQDIDEDAYQRTLKEAVNDVVARQVEAGIDVPDDGEMGKASWITYLYGAGERPGSAAHAVCRGTGHEHPAREPGPAGLPWCLRSARRDGRGCHPQQQCRGAARPGR